MGEPQPITAVTLDSAMITWEDLGLRGLSLDQKEKIYYNHFADWLDTCKGDYRGDPRGIWFARGNEAVMFKMTFAGKITR